MRGYNNINNNKEQVRNNLFFIIIIRIAQKVIKFLAVL